MFEAIAAAVGGKLIEGIFNARESSANRDFQAGMSSTAHQREVKDLKAAGLNPILSAKYGGASTPAGSTASISAPDFVGAANSTNLTKAQIAQANASAALSAASARQVEVNTALDAKYGPAERLGRGDAWKVYAAKEAGSAAKDTFRKPGVGLTDAPFEFGRNLGERFFGK